MHPNKKIKQTTTSNAFNSATAPIHFNYIRNNTSFSVSLALSLYLCHYSVVYENEILLNDRFNRRRNRKIQKIVINNEYVFISIAFSVQMDYVKAIPKPVPLHQLQNKAQKSTCEMQKKTAERKRWRCHRGPLDVSPWHVPRPQKTEDHKRRIATADGTEKMSVFGAATISGFEPVLCFLIYDRCHSGNFTIVAALQTQFSHDACECIFRYSQKRKKSPETTTIFSAVNVRLNCICAVRTMEIMQATLAYINFVILRGAHPFWPLSLSFLLIHIFIFIFFFCLCLPCTKNGDDNEEHNNNTRKNPP